LTANLKQKSSGKLNILVAEEHRESLQSALDQIQHNAYANVLGATTLLSHVEDAEDQLEEAEIANSHRAGATFSVTPSGPSANAYKFSQLGTAATFERKKGGWFLTHIERVTVWPRQSGKERLSISAKQKGIVISKLLKKFEISKNELHLFLSEPRL
jgi:hypothetical protein